jgi:hypothetical protein
MKSMKFDINLEYLTSKNKKISIWSLEFVFTIRIQPSGDQIDISLVFEVKYSRLMSNFMLFILWKIAQKSLKRPKSLLRCMYLALFSQKRAFFQNFYCALPGSISRYLLVMSDWIMKFHCFRVEKHILQPACRHWKIYRF